MLILGGNLLYFDPTMKSKRSQLKLIQKMKQGVQLAGDVLLEVV